MNSKHVPAAVTGVAVAAVAAGAAAYWMNHTTCRSRKRAIKRASAKVSDFMNTMVNEVSKNILG